MFQLKMISIPFLMNFGIRNCGSRKWHFYSAVRWKKCLNWSNHIKKLWNFSKLLFWCPLYHIQNWDANSLYLNFCELMSKGISKIGLLIPCILFFCELRGKESSILDSGFRDIIVLKKKIFGIILMEFGFETFMAYILIRLFKPYKFHDFCISNLFYKNGRLRAGHLYFFTAHKTFRFMKLNSHYLAHLDTIALWQQWHFS